MVLPDAAPALLPPMIMAYLRSTARRGSAGSGSMNRMLMGSLLDGAADEPRGDVALAGKQQHDGGNGREHGGGHDGVPARVLVADIFVDAERNGNDLALRAHGQREEEIG